MMIIMTMTMINDNDKNKNLITITGHISQNVLFCALENL